MVRDVKTGVVTPHKISKKMIPKGRIEYVVFSDDEEEDCYEKDSVEFELDRAIDHFAKLPKKHSTNYRTSQRTSSCRLSDQALKCNKCVVEVRTGQSEDQDGVTPLVQAINVGEQIPGVENPAMR